MCIIGLYRYIQDTCATSGEGLYEGLDWLSENIGSKVISSFYFIFVKNVCVEYEISATIILAAQCLVSLTFGKLEMNLLTAT